MREFEYAAPRTVKEAVALLARANGDARCLAGGTDLIAQMKEGRRSPSLIVDIKRIPDLMRLDYVERRGLRLGAGVPCSTIYEHPVVREKYPIIVDACSLVGSLQIQNRASVGGNLCNGAPSADTAPAFLALNATAVVAGPRGRRQLPLTEFFVGPGKTALAPGELLVEIIVPPPPARSAGNYLRFIPRNEMDIAVAGVGSVVVLGAKGVCKDARIALASVAPVPLRAHEAEERLRGRPLDAEAIREAGALAAAACKPISDVRGSADYRRHLVNVLTQRTLYACLKQLGVTGES
ncbi:MAG: xanthine dehydrogenase family protein subunit M [Dehalococcoidia bacterium]|nr:xanthine dehydrogenase family protein subunit M [Dehalococcoidia bacterium]